VPIYEYRCNDCGAVFEVFQKFSDDPVEICEKCSGPVTKVLHPAAIHFKGSGFYTTDYGRGKKMSRSAGATESADKKSDGGSDSGGAKPAGDKGGKSSASDKSGGGAASGSGAASKVTGTSS
jgi:putative FmdB family regulatory protein